MDKNSLLALVIGFFTGAFLIYGGAYILKRTFKLMDTDGPQKSTNWSIGQAFGLASLWTSKIILACAILYFAQKWGFPIKFLGLGIPAGLIIAVLAIRGKEESK